MSYISYNICEVDIMKFEVEFYETADGETPVEDFLWTLDSKMRAKLVNLMEVLEDKGNSLREPYTKPLKDGIFELRCKLGSNLTRALFFFYVDGKIIITNGFIKKTQKTPPEEIELAMARREDYIKRKREENEKSKTI